MSEVPAGAVYIPPKKQTARPVEKWPRFVWVADPYMRGFCSPEIWYLRQTTGILVKGKLQDQSTISEHEMKPGDEDLSFETLARIYPLPANWKRRVYSDQRAAYAHP